MTLGRTGIVTAGCLLLALLAAGCSDDEQDPAAGDHVDKAHAAMAAKRYEKAVQEYTLVMESGTLPLAQFPEAYCNRGRAFYETGDLDRALTDFMRAIELRPEYAEAYHNRGMVHRKMGQDAEAVADFRKAKELGYVPPK